MRGDASVRRAVSRDGTKIAFWESGAGPPLVLVHGAPADHTRFEPLLPFLEPHATVYAMDRRGRGASGDGPEYGMARECEDVAAVVDVVAESSGSAVDLYGHSFGGFVAFGAAALTSNVRALVLYEGWPAVDASVHAFPPGVGERLAELLGQGNREAMVDIVFRELVGMTEEELVALRSQPAWPARVAAAERIVREVRAIPELTLGQAGKITAPTLLVTGEESRDPSTIDLHAVAAALADARVVVLEDQGHVGDMLAPELFADRVIAFLRDPTTSLAERANPA